MTRTMNSCTMNTSVPAIARTSLLADQASVINRAWLIYAVWKERRALARLDECALKDLGLSSADVEFESSRSPLDLPRNRR